MTTANFKRIIKTIKGDATLQHQYHGKDRRCVIGGLAKEYGVRIPVKENNWIITRCLFADKLREKTKLSLNRLRVLQKINDRTDDLSERRKKLIRTVKSWK